MFFKDDLYFLSNMYPCSITAIYSGTQLTFSCVESAFQACKCMARAHEFVNLDGYQAKKIGRQVPLRNDWNAIRVSIMEMLVKIKFDQNPMLIEKLIQVNGDIVEENTWNDTFWGVCNGIGENHLGKILTKLRDQYRSNTFYLLVAGSRTYNNYDELKAKLDFVLSKKTDIVIVSGGADGADSLAERYAKEKGYRCEVFKAQWDDIQGLQPSEIGYTRNGKPYRKNAGYERNLRMHQFISQFPNRGCICFWDGKSKGTSHNFNLSHQNNTPLKVFDYSQGQFIKR
jgi:predicted NAD-dependent protein-ADP-ribosyltransferase YbiA (DUF1768 family)